MRSTFFSKLSILALVSFPIVGNAQLFFENQATQQNIDYAYQPGNVMGAGVSFCDFNGDGWDDLTIATSAGDSLEFYQNNNGTFVRITPLVDDTSSAKQINWVDIDNDGDKDLFVVGRDKGNKLYENTGNMNMVDITDNSNIDPTPMSGFGASWGDFNNDGYLDVYISTRAEGGTITNMLYRNEGNNSFTDVTTAAGLRDTNSFSFCAAWFDYNNDGWQDIYSTTDRIDFYPNRLYHNNGDGTFTDVSVSSNSLVFMDAMSATVADYNADGWLDFYVTNTDTGNVFLHNNGNGTFTDTAAGTGTIFNSIGWGAAFLDAENDGDLDLYVSGMGQGVIRQSSVLYENDGTGNYTEPTGIGFVGDSALSFGNAIGDYNNDGYFDIAVSNIDTNVHLWRNGGGTNNWIKVGLEGTVSNRDGIGSWIKVYTNGNMQTRYTLCGESYVSQFSGYEIIGLDTVTVIDSMEVNWLSGITDMLYQIPVNQTLNIVEGSMTWPPLTIIPNPAIICAGDSLELLGTAGYDHYLWSTGDTTLSTFVSDSGLVTVQAWMDFGLPQNSQLIVSISDPQLNLGADTTICVGHTITLDAGTNWSSVLWSDNSNSTTLDVDTSGVFFATVTDSVGCTTTDTVVVALDPCLGLSENSIDEVWEIYPNPTTGVAFISSKQLDNTILSVEVFDVEGRLLKHIKGKGTASLAIDLESLSNGWYIISIHSSDSAIRKRLLITD
jgi:hypothetical protein